MLIQDPFIPIEDWLTKVVHASDEAIGALANDPYRLEIRLQDLRPTPDRPPLLARADVLVSIHQRLRGLKVERKLWNALLYGGKFTLPEAVASDLIDREMCLDVLPYCVISETQLRRLSKRDSTAAYWIALMIYTDSSRPCAELETFLSQHRHHRNLVQSLFLNVPPVMAQKEGVLIAEVLRRPDAALLMRERDGRMDAVHARRTDLAASEAIRLFATGSAHVLRSLAENPQTPEDLLEKLAVVVDFKFAKQIRHAAQQTLHGKREDTE